MMRTILPSKLWMVLSEGLSSSFLYGSSPGTQHPGAKVEVSRRTGQTKKEFIMMDWNGNGMSMLGWLGMGLFWFILLALIVWLVVRLLPGSSAGSSGGTGHSAVDSPVEILDRRLASGGIDLDTWQAQRAALQGAQQDRK